MTDAADTAQAADAEEQAQPAPAPAQTPPHDEQLLRALADLDNLRKRYSRELSREREAERRRAAAEWLPVVDNLERALAHADGGEALLEGVEAIRDQAVAALERLGYCRFEDVGSPFDPNRHEAVGTTQADAPAGTVVATLRPGYRTDEDVLRPAAVLVAS
ncbi:MAG TPA: nucleotide exchange factor GrpE [Acidimicrobiales bacterium]|jgi:molecular chaperone GrpE|nr:nucleotide exchange factor GrpE [Acidimicrobiales bacterium]